MLFLPQPGEYCMKLVSTRLIVQDINTVVEFYEFVTGVSADWLAPVFAEIVTPGAVIAIGSEETVALFKEGCAKPAANQSAILEFLVEDVDHQFNRLKEYGVAFVHEPKDMPWGNRTLQFRDPEGTRVILHTCNG
jgi:uncharacterized glyoxalase superfamily protein PhnB